LRRTRVRKTLSEGNPVTDTADTTIVSRQAGAPWSIEAAAEYLGVTTQHLYTLRIAGKIKTIKLGRRRLIPDAELQRLATEGT
jgi:excisionase family DNA binding protein